MDGLGIKLCLSVCLSVWQVQDVARYILSLDGVLIATRYTASSQTVNIWGTCSCSSVPEREGEREGEERERGREREGESEREGGGGREGERGRERERLCVSVPIVPSEVTLLG